VRPWEWPIADRIRLAHRLRADGRSVRDVAVHLGVSRWAVFRYQNASACDCCGEPALIDAGDLCPRCRPPARTPAWERERALDAIRAWQREFGRPPSASEWSHADPTGAWARQHPRFPSYEQVTCLFGNWGAALQAAGTKAANVHWTPETIVAALQRWAQVNGRPPTQHDWRNRHPDRMHPSASVAANHFGSWSAALRAAGLTPATRRWTPDELVDALRAWERRHGHAPTSSEWPNAGAGSDHPARGTIVNHFGNWIQALHAAGLEPRRRADRERLLRLNGRPTAHARAARLSPPR
jgi:hypothetical protein